MITKKRDGYYLKAKSTGKNLGGPYKTKAMALRRERQVKMFKHMSGKK